MAKTRRQFLEDSALGGLGVLSLGFSACSRQSNQSQRDEQKHEFKVLGAEEVDTLNAFGEILVPGSAGRGLSQYIDHQLAAPVQDSMLMIRYLGVSAPHVDFYKSGIEALNNAARAQYSNSFSALGIDDAEELVAQIVGNKVDVWIGPPAAFFMFVLRADATDVYYGTVEGFAGLGIPYRAHIQPPSRWGE